MASTEQRTGFRLPWVSEARASATATDDGATDLERAAALERLTAAGAESAGDGDVGKRAPTGLAWPAADTSRGDAGQSHGAGGGDLPPPDNLSDPGPEPATSAAEGAAPVPAPAAAHGRRDNPLVTGLVRAMRDAATATRAESATRFTDEAKARVEAIHVHSSDEAARLRKRAEADVVEIREWSKSETARIRELTDEKIADRKGRLEVDVEALSTRVEERIEQVRLAVSAFEQEMNTFFERLLAEEDPARLAGLAEQLPEPPILDIDISLRLTPNATLDADGAAAAEAAAYAEIETADADGTEEADEPADAGVPDQEVARRRGSDAAPVAATPDPVTTRVAVAGLASVASIAGFKRALAKSAGVRTVSVASGPTGDFIFTVAHEAETDLRSIVPLFDGFAAVITADAEGVVTVSATDPERAQ